MGEPTRIRVGGEQPYDVVVGYHLLGELPGLLGDKVRKALIVHSGALAASAEAIRDDLEREGYQAFLAEVPDAEEAKSAQVAAFCWHVLGQADFTRSDAVIGIGGGATTDLAGFVGSTWLRGVRVVQIPTTVVGMVDAAIGGKTGINTEEGKNLVGTFWPPAGVLCDLAALDTLPVNERVAGLGEVVKHGFIADERTLELIEADPAALTGPTLPDRDLVRELVERSVRVKAEVVTDDLREAFRREILNYGHTLGHAIEKVERYRWRHGAAVSVGMVFAAELARLAGRLADDVVERHRAILTALGLPTTYRADRWEQLLATMRRDKKARGDLLRFVVLEDVGRPVRLEGPDPALLAAAFAEVSREPSAGAGVLL
jgi:3-dehydroquinate synthase